MHCPFCRHTDSRVVDSRTTDDGTVDPPAPPVPGVRPPVHHGRERRASPWSSASGATEPFSRAKVARRRPQGLPGPPGHRGRPRAARPAGRGEHPGQRGSAEIDAHEVGLAILGPLRELDEVAYLRFASVYRAFDSLEDFEAAIALLRAEREPPASSRAPTAAQSTGTPPARRAAHRHHLGDGQQPRQRPADKAVPRSTTH